jgi:hypothetical protein
LRALFSNTTGSRNIAVGAAAGEFLVSGDDNIYLNNLGGSPDESRTMRLGQIQTRTFIAGLVGINGQQVLIDTATGQLGTLRSSARYKSDIRPMGAHSRGLLQLHPVTFRYTQDPQRERQYGLIAEEVAKVYPELVTRNAAGEIEAVRYHELVPMLLNEVQRQQRQAFSLEAQNAGLQAAEKQLQDENAAATVRLQRLEAAAAGRQTLASASITAGK